MCLHKRTKRGDINLVITYTFFPSTPLLLLRFITFHRGYFLPDFFTLLSLLIEWFILMYKNVREKPNHKFGSDFFRGCILEDFMPDFNGYRERRTYAVYYFRYNITVIYKRAPILISELDPFIWRDAGRNIFSMVEFQTELQNK